MKRLVALAVVLFSPAAARAASEPWTLPQAIDYALTNSPDARVAAQRILAANAGLLQANAALWPQLQFQAGYVRTDNPMLAFGAILNQRAYSPSLNFNDVPDVDNLNVQGILGYSLYAGGRTTAQRKGARAQQEAAAASAEAVRNNLGFEVTRGFYSIHKTREFVLAATSAVQAYEGNLNLARDRFQAGTLLRADVLDVEVRLARAREDLVRARSAQALALQSLRTLLGLTDPAFAIAETAPAPAPPGDGDTSRRPELAAARKATEAAEYEVKKATGGYLPNVKAFGTAGYDHGWVLDGSGGSYAAGIQLQWDLWDGRLTQGRVREVRANLEAALEQERKVQLGLELELQQTRLNLKDALERLQVTETVVAQAAESVDLTRTRFEQGLALPAQLLDAESALTGARMRRAEAEADRRIALAALRRALGLPQLSDLQSPTPPRP